jgi:hypothetical protein
MTMFQGEVNNGLYDTCRYFHDHNHMSNQTDLSTSKVHAYCRVSTAEQSSRGYSLEEQERQCRRIALARYPGHEFVLWSVSWTPKTRQLVKVEPCP